MKTLEFIIIQGIGFLGLLAGIIAVQFNKHKTIVLWKTVMEILFIVQYYFLHAYVGMVMGVIGVIRNVIFTQLVAQKKSTKIPIILACIVTVIAGILTLLLSWEKTVNSLSFWTNNYNVMLSMTIIISVMSIVAKILSTIGYGKEDPKTIRALNYPSSSLWLVYNVISFSLSGIITEVLVLISLTIATIRYKDK